MPLLPLFVHCGASKPPLVTLANPYSPKGYSDLGANVHIKSLLACQIFYFIIIYIYIRDTIYWFLCLFAPKHAKPYSPKGYSLPPFVSTCPSFSPSVLQHYSHKGYSRFLLFGHLPPFLYIFAPFANSDTV